MSSNKEHRMCMLPEPEAAVLLAASGIPYVQHGVAESVDEAAELADGIGYPVVLKVVSPDIVHKTEVGGVVLRVGEESVLREAYDSLRDTVGAACPSARLTGVIVAKHIETRREAIIGALYDETFGTTVMVGLGGIFAEILDDVACRIAPLTHADGLDMLRELRGARLFSAVRGEEPVDPGQLADFLVGVGELALGHPEIAEIDLNPVAVSAHGCIALDARVIVRR
jgi:acyl-CoA synthetase (NDP forming)